MKQQHSLDHDGLDGILQSSLKPKSKYFYLRLFWLLPILIIFAGATFWLKANQQIYPLKSSAKQGILPHSSEDKIIIAKNESPAAPVSSQSVQPSSAGQSGNVALPIPDSVVPALPKTIHVNQSPATLEMENTHSPEPAGADTAASGKPPAIEPRLAKNSQKLIKPLIDENIKVKFKLASSEVNLSKTERTDLTRLLEKCNNQIQITGYTCNLGSSEFNQKLGLARANALKQVLISKGVPAERIITASKGMQSPVAPNEAPSGRALNRRAELTCKGSS